MPKVLDQTMHLSKMKYFLAFSDTLFTKIFIFIHCLFRWEKYKELIMDGWENNNLGGDSVDVAICSVAVTFFSGHWDTATLECEAAMTGCLFSTIARCNSCCFWSLCSRGISLTPGKSQLVEVNVFLHVWTREGEVIMYFWLQKSKLHWLKFTLDIYSLIYT